MEKLKIKGFIAVAILVLMVAGLAGCGVVEAIPVDYVQSEMEANVDSSSEPVVESIPQPSIEPTAPHSILTISNRYPINDSIAFFFADDGIDSISFYNVPNRLNYFC